MLAWYKRWHTTLLALLSFVMFVGSAIFIFDVRSSEIMHYMVMALLMTLAAVVAAGVFLLLIHLLKKKP